MDKANKINQFIDHDNSSMQERYDQYLIELKGLDLLTEKIPESSD